MATSKVQARYTQKRTLNAVTSHGPHEGTPNACVFKRRTASDNHIHGKKRLSVGCVREAFRAPGFWINRDVIIVKLNASITMKTMKITLPIVVRPVKVCGCALRRFDIPPVDIVNVNQTHVKCAMRPRSETSPT